MQERYTEEVSIQTPTTTDTGVKATIEPSEVILISSILGF